MTPSPPTGHQTGSDSSSQEFGPRVAFDLALGTDSVAGTDEAGRGCLAGPIVGAAVRFDYNRLDARALGKLAALNDSKQLSPARRDILFETVVQYAAAVSVVSRSARTIDRNGLHRSNLAVLAETLNAVATPGCALLVDGFTLKEFPFAHQPVKKGDTKSTAIAAASIVAKTVRDRAMTRIAELHELWGFDAHFGYATADHREAIQAHGVSQHHRLSFNSTAYTQLQLAPN